MVNHEFNEYGYNFNEDFVGLEPKVMDILGDEYCAGGSEEVLSVFDPTARGVDQLKVVSSQLISGYESSESGDTANS